MIGNVIKPLHLELDLEQIEPLAGTLTWADGQKCTFTGWLDLCAALEEAFALPSGSRQRGTGAQKAKAE